MIYDKKKLTIAAVTAALIGAVTTVVVSVSCTPELDLVEPSDVGKACTTDVDCPYYLACSDKICRRRCSAGGSYCGGSDQCDGTVCRPYNYSGYSGFRSTTPSVSQYTGYGETLAIPFTWHDTAGQPAPQDLSLYVELDGKRQPLVQVFSIDDKPFVRAGNDVRPIEADRAYDVVITRKRQQVQAVVTPTLGNRTAVVTTNVLEAFADTVVVERPGAAYRQTIR